MKLLLTPKNFHVWPGIKQVSYLTGSGFYFYNVSDRYRLFARAPWHTIRFPVDNLYNLL